MSALYRFLSTAIRYPPRCLCPLAQGIDYSTKGKSKESHGSSVYAVASDPYEPADFTNRPLDWTIGGLTPAMTFFSNVQMAASLGISLNLLPCKHFPQVSIPDLLADHIRRSASRHLT